VGRVSISWEKKTPRTGYFGEEDWEGDGQPYKPVSYGPAMLAHKVLFTNVSTNYRDNLWDTEAQK
jgi:hypothetical protein